VLGAYTLGEQIGEADGLALYRGAGTSGPILLKVTNIRPPPRMLSRLEHELEVATILPSSAVLEPIALVSVDDRVALAFEYFDGVALSRLIAGPMELAHLLRIAIGICSALIEVHRSFVHGDVNSNNVVVDLATNQVRLTGLGVASLIAVERPPSESIDGALAYISPEATRRTSHAIDTRSDLYSLGVVLYQLATGGLPFRSRDLLGWIHAHLARTPVPPHQVVAGIPGVVSEIILKLLAKSPDDRYQTAAGLRADLQRCLNAYTARATIESFPLGAQDVSDRFQIPARRYGRRVESTALRSAFERVVADGAARVSLIVGGSGEGKTTLVRELQEPVARASGLFAKGKCDQYDHQSPYRVVSQACSSLVRQLLARTDEEIGYWRSELARALGLHGRLITDLVPELTLLVGEQPPVIELPVTQAELRLFQVFWRLLNAFTSAEHPLVMLVDDLQWADSASLRLLQHVIADPDTRNVLFIGAYRPAGAQPALQTMFDELRKRAIEVEEIVLGGLSVAEIEELLRDTLHRPASETTELATLVRERTDGHPFDVIELLTALHRSGAFRFDAQRASWTWDIERVRTTRATENIVDLLLARLGELPASSLELLRLGASLGSRFTLDVVARVARRDVEVVRRGLFEAIHRGLLIRTDGAYAFAHDRVQQAAYALIAEIDRPGLHRAIGWLLAGQAAPTSLGDELFAVASHLRRGISAITDAEERRRVTAFLLAAGRRARAGAAYELAADYLSAGIGLLDATSWETDYDTAFALHFELAQCSYLTANPAAAEPLLAQLFARAQTRSETAALYRMKVELSWMRDDLEAAVDAIIACLALYGVRLDRHPSAETAAAYYERASAALERQPIEALAALPPTNEPDIAQLLATLSTAFPCAYWYDPNLHFSLSSLAMRLAIEHDISPSAAHVFADFGMIIGALRGRHEDGYRLGRVAVELADRPGYESVKSKVYMVFGGMTAHWTHPLTESSFIEGAFTSGVELGDLLHAANSCVLVLETLLGSSVRLDLVHERALSFQRFLQKTGFAAMGEVVEYERQLVESLHLADHSLPWWRDIQHHARTRFGRMPCRIAQLQAAFAFGDHELAARLAIEIAPTVDEIRGYWRVADFHFLSALALAARYPDVTRDEQSRFLDQLQDHRRRYETWAGQCPENFASRRSLICAEMARLAGDDLEAIKHYEQAIAEARNAHSLADEGTAYEVAARFYRSRNLKRIEDAYLREARACYQQWGAAGKVKWLDAQHPQLEEAVLASGGGAVEQIDVEALTAALFAISSEIDRPRLVSTIMRVVMQQAGAERGVLVKISAEQWSAEVEGVLAGDELIIRTAPAALDTAVAVPVSVIRRVSTRPVPFVVADAERVLTDEGDGAYFAAHQPRSALCVPVVCRGTVVAALYLEHHGLRGAFSPATVRTTTLLTSQVAISLENSELYAELLTENAHRRAAETALAASRAHLQSVLDHIVDGVLACDTAGQVMLANHALEDLTGIPRSEIEGLPATQLAAAVRLGPGEGQRFLDEATPLQRALDGATVLDIPATLVRRDGAVVHIRVSSAPIIGPGSVTIGAVSVIHDVTPRAQLEAMKEQFIRVAAHELKTPVTIIRLGAQRLLSTPATQTATLGKHAEIVARGAERIQRVVDALLLLSELQAGRFELAFEEVELEPLVADIVQEAARQYRGALRLTSEPVVVRADRAQLKLVIAHLIDNAMRYSPLAGDIDVAVRRRGEDAVVEVRDRGIGIPAEKRPHIFESFFRAHTDTPYDVGGMGVGLYLSREIARHHDGNISVVSEECVGSTFELTVPLADSSERWAHGHPPAERPPA
jgi:PAS domain S-box-containing protein